MKTMKIFAYTFLAIFLTLASCSGEDGIDGAQGEQGVPGEDGNANVTSVLFDSIDITIGENNFDIPEITQDIYENGLVMIYAQNPDDTIWLPLPIIDGSGNIQLKFNTMSLGAVQVISILNATINIRFVIIEGTPVSGRSSQQSHQDLKSYYEGRGVDFSDYTSVAAYFNLDKNSN